MRCFFRAHRRALMKLIAAVTAGSLLYASRTHDMLWLLALPVPGLLFFAVYRSGKRLAALSGLTAGACFWFPLINWLTLYLGPVPHLALAGVMTAWFTLFTLFFSLCSRRLGAPSASFVFAACWVARELLECSVPYGGFSWGRFAASFAGSPLLQSLSLTGIAGFALVMVFLCALPVAYLVAQQRPGCPVKAKPTVVALSATVGAVAAVICLASLPIVGVQAVGVLRVAAVQGNAKAGIFDNRENGAVFADHYAATAEYLAELSDPSPELIVWPENGAELAVDEKPARLAKLQRLSAKAAAPIMVGTILRENQGDNTAYYNAALTLDARGQTLAKYEKLNPVPFGEYMPNREFFRALAPDLVDLVRLEYQTGRHPVTQTINGVRVGHAICFDATFDRHTKHLISGDAQLFVSITNNADFGRTAESYQQLALTKLQAVSSGRALVNISTVGTSGLFDNTGRELASIPAHTAGVISAELPLYSGATPAFVVGGVFTFTWLSAACAVVCFTLVRGKILLRH